MQAKLFTSVFAGLLFAAFCSVDAQNAKSQGQQFSELYAQVSWQVQSEINNSQELRLSRAAASEYTRNRMRELFSKLDQSGRTEKNASEPVDNGSPVLSGKKS